MKRLTGLKCFVTKQSKALKLITSINRNNFRRSCCLASERMLHQLEVIVPYLGRKKPWKLTKVQSHLFLVF